MIVAGAGIIGLTCAWRLAQKGMPVRLFDARETGAEASWAGAGMLSPGGEVAEDSPLARMAIDSLAAWPAFVKELEEASGQSIDYQTCGAIERACTDEEAQALRQRAAQQAAIGIRSDALNNFDRFYPGDAIVDPRDVTAALRIACLRAGVKLHEHEPVLEILPGGTSVRTAKAVYADDAILIAAGAWSATLCPPEFPKSIPVRGHLIAWDATGIRLGPILRYGHTYILQRARNGRIIAGSSTEYAGFDRTLNESIAAGIHARASLLLPTLASLKPSESWLGFRPGLEGDSTGPVIGKIAGGSPGSSLWAAFGHYRNGILLAPETARIVSESLIGR
ncbi:MAG TPA: FAD-dependent oxidoreductase [Bryobacteraceae bacterium]|jgi:glycine oxidase|nr:FAD-dependent oxidoreductase [Bryobacteraceae bacterium]